jgi:hypothetical protein
MRSRSATHVRGEREVVGLEIGPLQNWAITNPDAKGDLPWLMAGVITDGIPKLAVWLETEPNATHTKFDFLQWIT